VAKEEAVEAAQEYEVTILSREEIVEYPKIRTPVPVVAVSYVAAGLPPATIRIPKDKWTKELERSIIRKDIERRLKVKPETYRV